MCINEKLRFNCQKLSKITYGILIYFGRLQPGVEKM